MFELAFELAGFSVNSGASAKAGQLEKADVVLVDVIADNVEEWQVANNIPKKHAHKTALILPRGAKTAKAANAALVIKRPFELMEVVKKVSSNISTGSPPNTRGDDKRKPKDGRPNTPKKSSSSRKNLRRRSLNPRKP